MQRGTIWVWNDRNHVISNAFIQNICKHDETMHLQYGRVLSCISSQTYAFNTYLKRTIQICCANQMTIYQHVCLLWLRDRELKFVERFGNWKRFKLQCGAHLNTMRCYACDFNYTVTKCFLFEFHMNAREWTQMCFPNFIESLLVDDCHRNGVLSIAFREPHLHIMDYGFVIVVASFNLW